MTNKTLTYAERLILSNQFEILKKIYPEYSLHYENAQEIVNNGYEIFYDSINQSVMENTLSLKVSNEVIQILELYRALEFSCKNLGLNAKDLGADFKGFDGNETEGHYGFAYFLRRAQKKWQELEKYPDNSHSVSSLDTYRDMLDRWRAMKKKFELTQDEIKEIVGY